MIGVSEARRRKVSAAIMPPIEWPTRMVCTEGSTVGEGSGVCNLDVDDFVQ